MSGLAQAAGALVGAAFGAAAALAAARAIGHSRAWAFWAAVVAAFAAGIALTAWSAAAGLHWLAAGTIAFPLGFTTALKWATGRVPGVPTEHRADRDR